MKAIMHTLMLSCTKATELIERKSMDGLTFTDNIRLSMHTAMCNACKQYAKQSLLLNSAISQHINELPENKTKNKSILENQARERIQKELGKNLKKM